MKHEGATERPSFTEAIRFWSKLGWISFGGTAAHIAIMHDFLVERKKWISNSRFLHALSHCMILPGPEAQQLAIYIGWKLHGKKGGVAAGTLFVLPSMFILLALSIVYVRFGNLPWIAAMFGGLKPAVIALILLALWRVSKRALRSFLHGFVALAAFVAMFFFHTSLLLIILAVVGGGIAVAYLKPSLFQQLADASADEDEHDYFINRHSIDPENKLRPKTVFGVLIVGTILWALPAASLRFLMPDAAFWLGLTFFFTKTAFVTFGGSYTVIPYVAQLAVFKLGWLSRLQMTDGFALAETTPGPLIIVVAFVGFMAAYNHFHGSLLVGTIGLFVTTFYTFLPCFVFVFAGAPLVESSHGKPAIEGVLGLITAVVVGAILDLTLFLGDTVLFPAGRLTLHGFNILGVLWIALTLVLLQKIKLNVVYVILLSIAFGAAAHLLKIS